MKTAMSVDTYLERMIASDLMGSIDESSEKMYKQFNGKDAITRAGILGTLEENPNLINDFRFRNPTLVNTMASASLMVLNGSAFESALGGCIIPIVIDMMRIQNFISGHGYCIYRESDLYQKVATLLEQFNEDVEIYQYAVDTIQKELPIIIKMRHLIDYFNNIFEFKDE